MKGTPLRAQQRVLSAADAPVRERRDDEALLGAEVLVLVVEVHVRDGYDARAVVVDVIRRAVAPLEPRLLIPDYRRPAGARMGWHRRQQRRQR